MSKKNLIGINNQINLGNNVFHNLLDYGNGNIEKLSVDKD